MAEPPWRAIHQSFVRTISCVRMLVRTFVHFQGYSPKRAYVRKCKNCAYISERYIGFVRTKSCVYNGGVNRLTVIFPAN